MSIEVKVPVLPESVSDATIATWHKKAGDSVRRDENLLDLETDKVVLEVPSPVDGVLKELKFKEGDTVTSSQVIRDHRAGRGCRGGRLRSPLRRLPAKQPRRRQQRQWRLLLQPRPTLRTCRPPAASSPEANQINPADVAGTGPPQPGDQGRPGQLHQGRRLVRACGAPVRNNACR